MLPQAAGHMSEEKLERSHFECPFQEVKGDGKVMFDASLQKHVEEEELLNDRGN